MYVDGSAASVGIGATSPELKLHVRDGALASAPTPNSNCDVVIEGTDNTGIQFLSSNQTQLRFGDAASTAAGAIIYQHSDNQFKLNYSSSGFLTFNASGEKFRIASDGKLTHTYNIGTNGNAGLVLDTTDTSKASSILFKANGEDRARIDVQRLSGDGGQLKIQVAQMNNQNTMLDAITIAGGGPTPSSDTTPDVTLTGNLKLASSSGINFHDYGSGTNIDSNLLDDYEEGTWTPAPTAGSFTSATGRYTKVGRIVVATFDVQVNTDQGASFFQFNGFPFDNVASNAGENLCSFGFTDSGLNGNIVGTLYTGTAMIFANFSGTNYRYNTSGVSGKIFRGGVTYMSSV